MFHIRTAAPQCTTTEPKSLTEFLEKLLPDDQLLGLLLELRQFAFLIDLEHGGDLLQHLGLIPNVDDGVVYLNEALHEQRAAAGLVVNLVVVHCGASSKD